MIQPYFAVIEIQINEGVPSSPPVVFVNTIDDAMGELYTKLGYAYQHPRDYTAVVVINERGQNLSSQLNAQFVFDNREEKLPIYSFAEIQINDGVRSAVPVNVQVGDDAESIAMQAYHHAMEYAWNVKRNYTEGVVINTRGMNERVETVDFMPVEVPSTPVVNVPN